MGIQLRFFYVTILGSERTDHLLIGETILVGARIVLTPLLYSVVASQVKCAALTFHQPCHRKIDAPRKYPSLPHRAYKTAGMVDHQDILLLRSIPTRKAKHRNLPFNHPSSKCRSRSTRLLRYDHLYLILHLSTMLNPIVGHLRALRAFNFCYILSQFPCVLTVSKWFDLEAGVQKTISFINEAGQAGSKLIAFPEVCK